MSNLSSDELADLRATLSGMDFSVEKQDEFIRIIDNFAMASADKAYGISNIQISLSSIANYSFDGVDVSAKVRRSRKVERVASQEEGMFSKPNIKEPCTP